MSKSPSRLYSKPAASKQVAAKAVPTKIPKDQFAPTAAEPVRQRYKMGGGC